MTDLAHSPSDDRSLDAVPNAPDRHHPIGFMLRLAKALHTYGVPAYELENTMNACAAKLGWGMQCLSLPTSITMTFLRAHNDVRTYVIRVAPGDVNLEKLQKVSDIAHQVMEGKLSTKEGADELRVVTKSKPVYSWPLMIIAFAVVSSAVCRLFGGGLNEIITAFFAGGAIGVLTWYSIKHALLAHLLPATAALLSTLIAYGFAQIFDGLEVYIGTVSGLIILLPGLTLTIAMAELATQNLMSGTARLFGAGTVFILMAFGVVTGTHLAQVLGLNASEHQVLLPLPAWTDWLAVFLGSMSMVVLFQARLKDAVFVVMGGLVAIISVKLASQHFNNAMTAFIGAISVGVCANLVSRWRKIPGANLVIPGFIMLVPGSVGFKSLTALVEHDVVKGLDTAFNMILVGVSLVSGLLISSLVSLPKAPASQDEI